jgi:hypothetical protein
MVDTHGLCGLLRVSKSTRGLDFCSDLGLIAPFLIPSLQSTTFLNCLSFLEKYSCEKNPDLFSSGATLLAAQCYKPTMIVLANES